MVKIAPPRNHSKTTEWRTFHTSKALTEQSTKQRWQKLSHLELEEYLGGGNAEIPRHHRGKAGAVLVEPALVYIIWERSHMRVTGDRAGMPPLNNIASTLNVQAVIHNNYNKWHATL